MFIAFRMVLRNSICRPRMQVWQRFASTGFLQAATSSSTSLRPEIVISIRKILQDYPRDQLTNAQFAALCVKFGVGSTDAAALLQRFRDAGVVVTFDENQELIHVRPDKVLGTLNDILQIKHDPFEAQREELKKLKAELVPLQEQKDFVDGIVQRSVNRFFAVSGAVLAIQMAVLARFTFIDFDWDIMEPVTYFLTSGTATLMFGYYAWNRAEYTYPGLEQKLLSRRQHRFYNKHRFDYPAYVAKVDRIRELEQFLERATAPQ